MRVLRTETPIPLLSPQFSQTDFNMQSQSTTPLKVAG